MSLAGYNLTPQAAAKEAMWAAQAAQPLLPNLRVPAGASYPTSGPSNPNGKDMFADDWWANITSMSSADRAEAAAKVSAVYFCCSLIAVIVGSLPRVFNGPDGRNDPAMPISDLVLHAPNRLQTGDEFWSSMAFRSALAGIAFAEPVGSVLQGVEMWPLTPVRTEVDWEDRDFEIRYSPERGPMRVLRPQDVFWFAGLADSTARPLTPWRMAKGSIDFALALESQGRDFFSNGARLAGLLTTEDKLTDEAIARLKASIAGWRSGKIPVLEQGLTFKDVASNNTDSQLAELIKQRTLELARYWHIPKSLIGEEGGAKANHEQEALDFVKYSIRPWTRRIEQAVRNRLMTPDQRARWTFKMNLDGLLRGDSATQFRNAVLARTAGTHSIDDLRRDWFDLPEYNEDWSQDPRAPLNSNRAADSVTGGQTAPQDQSAMRAMIAQDIMETDDA